MTNSTIVGGRGGTGGSGSKGGSGAAGGVGGEGANGLKLDNRAAGGEGGNGGYCGASDGAELSTLPVCKAPIGAVGLIRMSADQLSY